MNRFTHRRGVTGTRGPGGITAWAVLGLLTALAVNGDICLGAVEAVEGGIRFSYQDPTVQSVAVAGDFNGWSTTANTMTKEGDTWSVVIPFEPGDHEYKYVVDGQWVADPDNPVTQGEYGNSAISVQPDGSLGKMKATSNTALSPKIWAGGRAIGLYLYEENELREDRYELERPQLDIDLDFVTRINSDLTAHVLTNINNEAENVDLWQTRLNFDRGSLTLDNSAIYVKAWENEGIVSWDDPLHLVGKVGIYDHEFGYGTVGARAKKEIHGFEAELLYTDDIDTGVDAAPQIRFAGLTQEANVVLGQDGTFSFAYPRVASYNFDDSDHREDILAVRVKRDLGSALDGSWQAAGMARLDRGYRNGSLAFVDVDPTDRSGTKGEVFQYTNSFEDSRAFGGDVRYRHDTGLTVHAEYLRGTRWIDAISGTKAAVELTTSDSLAVLDQPEVEETTPVANEEFDLDESNRFWLGADWLAGPLGFDWGLSLEFQDQALSPLITNLGTELDNSVIAWRGRAAKSWDTFPAIDQPVTLEADFEFFDFDYETRTPWDAQFWFDQHNLWLDHGEHKVDYHKLTLLGGHDALVWRPSATVRVHEGREVDLTYRGLLGSQGFDRKPKYWESLFLARGRLAKDWEAYLDTRVVRYDDPIFDIKETYTAAFLEVTFSPAEQVSLSLSIGVDPYAIDAPVNEYAYIGRDQYLFDNGANAVLAERSYLTLGRLIREAEASLEENRRIQLEGIIRF